MLVSNLKKWIVLVLILSAVVFGCHEDATVNQSTVVSVQSINEPPPGVTFLKWNSLAKWGDQRGWESKLCTTRGDTWVGSDTATYGNRVKIWHDAIWDTVTVTVQVFDSTFAAVDFLPSMTFRPHDPEVQLCYRETGITDAEAKLLKVYWWNPGTNTWDMINDNPTVDSKKDLIKFTVTHFSRYAFGR